MTEPALRPAAATPCPDIAATAIYPLLARVSLFELHANLLELLGKGLATTAGPRNLVVVGPGAEALPFSERLEATSGLLQGGNLVLLDYNQEICAQLPGNLQKAGFASRFLIEHCRDEALPDLNSCRNTILIKEWDLRNGLPLPAGSVAAIDMTVALHHVTQYADDIDALFRQAGTVLAMGGILHIGEGNVDMKYSERKLRRLARDVCTFGARGVLVADGRHADTAPRQWHVGEGRGEAMLRITADGMVAIDHGAAKMLASFLRKAGYKQLYANDTIVVLPLIDHAMEEDFQEMIVPVRTFYHTLTELCLQRLDPSRHEEFYRVVHKEQSDAERGIVEYYSLPGLLVDALKGNGFSVDELRYTTNGPFVNILASKQAIATG